MSLGQDPRLIVAHWADEETRAAATDASEARENRDQDKTAAVARADAERAHHRSAIGRILDRLRQTPR